MSEDFHKDLLQEREKALRNLENLLTIRDREVFELKARCGSQSNQSEGQSQTVISALETENLELSQQNSYLKRELEFAACKIEDQMVAIAAYERSVEEKLSLIREMEENLVKRWNIIEEYDKALAEARATIATLTGT